MKIMFGQVHNAELAEPAEFFFREIKLRALSLRYRAKNQNAELAELYQIKPVFPSFAYEGVYRRL